MTSDTSRFQHPWFARVELRLSRLADRGGAAEHRKRLLAGLSGQVIEVGAGGGPNFAHYPPSVSEVLAVEPDDTLRVHAERAVATAPVPVRVVPGHADRLPADTDSMDAAVASLVLCSVPDPASALAEISRVLVPGGELRFYEHVRSTRAPVGVIQDLLTPLWKRAAGGCHPNRDTAAAIRAAGYTIDQIEQIPFGLMRILGRAHLPASRESEAPAE